MSKADSGPDGVPQTTEHIQCQLCEREFDEMDHVVDHMEQAHSLVTNVIERNTRTVVREDTEVVDDE